MIHAKGTGQEFWPCCYGYILFSVNGSLQHVLNMRNHFMQGKIPTYFINTNETPGKLSPENMTSSCVKITCYLHT